MSADWETLRVGDERRLDVGPFERFHFARYAGASGDFNPLHFDESAARAAGHETVFGHGMLSAGVLSQIPAAWFGPESIQRYAVRFRTPLWPGDTVSCQGRVARVYERDGRRCADLVLTAKNQKGEVLVRGEATVWQWRP